MRLTLGYLQGLCLVDMQPLKIKGRVFTDFYDEKEGNITHRHNTNKQPIKYPFT